MDGRPAEAAGAPVALALVADLLFASRVRGAAAAVGVGAATVRTPEEFLASARRARPRLLLVDLEAPGDLPGLIAALKSDPRLAGVPVVAFGAHVHTDALRAARAAGADRVLARSAFVRDLPDLLLAAADGGAGDAAGGRDDTGK